MPFNAGALRDRAELNRAIRRYFDNSGYMEADSPLLAEVPIPESHIELFRTDRLRADGTSTPMYLLPSPEFWLKQLLANGAPSLYQIGRCFRNGEQLDRWHRLEFTMLEWYAVGSTADDNISVIEGLLEACTAAVSGPTNGTDIPPAISPPLRIITMDDAFREFAGFSLEDDLQNAGVAETAPSDIGFTTVLRDTNAVLAGRLKERGLPAGNSGDSADDLFHRLFLSLVEDELPVDRPLILKDWPQLVPTLARRIPGTPWAERWEMYLKGVEVANCYGEENDPDALRIYWESESALKAEAGVPVKGASDWPGLVSAGMPDCSGAAVGLDRLLAIIRGDGSLEGLDLFPINDMIRR